MDIMDSVDQKLSQKSTPDSWDVLSFTDALASMKGSCISKFFGAVKTSETTQATQATQAIGQGMANADSVLLMCAAV